jgi:hypothetical protein
MIDVNNVVELSEVEFNVGDRVSFNQQDNDEGSIESIRLISEGKLVETYKGAADRIVVTIHMKDSIINKRGMDIMHIA